jgi:hypothetical protein
MAGNPTAAIAAVVRNSRREEVFDMGSPVLSESEAVVADHKHAPALR